jgi:integrase
MSKKFPKLNREAMKALPKGEYICEHNIKYSKRENGDGVFEIYGTVDGIRIKRIIGRESEGVTRQTAEKAWEQMKTHAREQRLNLPKGRKLHMSFKEAGTKYLEQVEPGRSLRDKKQRMRDHLMPFFKDKALNQITTFDGEQYKRQRLENGAAPGTINRELALLSHVINKGIEWGWIDKRPCILKKLKEDRGRMTYLTVEQANRLIEVAKYDPHPYIYAVILIALGTAMRRSEILSIRLKNIDIARRTIFIPLAKAGSREQPMTEHLAQFLEKFMQGIPHNQPFLFAQPRSKLGHMKEVFKPFKRIVTAAGLDPNEIVFHSLRHTAITHLVQADVDLITVKRISGHKTLLMVERYAHQNGLHIQTAMDKLQNRYNLVSQ